MDVVLSSGFLAFARHIGFLSALEARGLRAEAVVGTSSGSMVGALWLAGLGEHALVEELGATAPLLRLAPSTRPWRGLLDMRPVVRRLRARLPARIEDLSRPFAVGVMNERGEHELLTRGPLAEAIAASCAMPTLFRAVVVEGVAYRDGGAVDRLGLDAWRRWRPGQRAVAHWVERTAGREVETGLSDVFVVRSPRSRARLWSLGDFRAQLEESRRLAAERLERLD